MKEKLTALNGIAKPRKIPSCQSDEEWINRPSPVPIFIAQLLLFVAAFQINSAHNMLREIEYCRFYPFGRAKGQPILIPVARQLFVLSLLGFIKIIVQY